METWMLLVGGEGTWALVTPKPATRYDFLKIWMKQIRPVIRREDDDGVIPISRFPDRRNDLTDRIVNLEQRVAKVLARTRIAESGT